MRLSVAAIGRWLWPSLFAVLLAACGGGGDQSEMAAQDDLPASGDAQPAREGPAAVRGALVNGGSVSSSLTAAGQSDSWTFTANTGNAFVLSAVRTTGSFDPVLRLYDPAGRLLRTASGAQVANANWSATVSGTYTVLVSDGGTGVQTGNYEVHLARSPGANEGGALVNGGLRTGSLTVGDLDTYTFTANSGNAFVLSVARTTGTFDPVVSLYDPTGRFLRSASGAQVANLSWNATVTGTYTVLVIDGGTAVQTGNYEVHLARAPGANEGGALANGGLRTGALTVGDLDTYTFTANSGNAFVLSVARTTGTFDPVVSLYDPTGRFLRSASGAQVANLSWNATVSGTYTVLVLDGGTAVQTGDYEVHLARSPGANEGGALVNGGLRTGSLTVGDLDTYTFTANSGNAFVLSVARTTGTFDPVVSLYDPTGRFLRSASGAQVANLSWNATVTGTYTVLVIDGGTAVQTGNYEVHLARAPGANEGGALTSGMPRAGDLTVGDQDSFTTVAAAGRSFVVTATRTSGTFDPVVYLYDPTGRFVRSASGATVASLSWTATIGGTYTIVIFDGGTAVQTGGYQVLVN